MTVEEAIHELENGAWWDALNVVMEAVSAQSANDEQMKKAGSGAVYDSDHGLVQNCGQIKPSGWISVADTLPYFSGLYLTFSPEGNRCEVLTYSAKYRVFYALDNSRLDFADVTHWMPLPEPPGEAKK